MTDNLHTVTADTSLRRFFYLGFVIEEAVNFDGRRVWEWTRQHNPAVGGECATLWEAIQAVYDWAEIQSEEEWS